MTQSNMPTPIADVPAGLDPLGRTPISSGMKQQISDAFKVVEPGKRGAVLVIVDGESARGHLAARINGSWKVAGGASFPWEGKKPDAWAGVVIDW